MHKPSNYSICEIEKLPRKSKIIVLDFKRKECTKIIDLEKGKEGMRKFSFTYLIVF